MVVDKAEVKPITSESIGTGQDGLKFKRGSTSAENFDLADRVLLAATPNFGHFEARLFNPHC